VQTSATLLFMFLLQTAIKYGPI